MRRLATIVVYWVLALTLGCDGSYSSDNATIAPGKTQPVAKELLYSQAELHGLGLRPVQVEGGGTLLCGGPDSRGCVCLEPLACEASGNCITFGQNVETLREALAHGQDGRTVQCRRGEFGRCGEFRYLDFSGDVERHEIRWFEGSGRLVAQRNWTDYPAYCDRKARTRFQGHVPKCSSPVREQLICGEAGGAVAAPIDDLAVRAGKPSATASGGQ